MSDTAGDGAALEGVIGDDGSFVVPRGQVSRLGLQPGTHLRVVPVGWSLTEMRQSQ